MKKLNFLKPLILTIPLVLVGCQQSSVAPNSVVGKAPCNVKDNFNVIIKVEKNGEKLTTSVEPYTLTIPRPDPSNPRNGNQRLTFVCLEGNAKFSGNSIVWNAAGSGGPPAGVFGFAKNPNGTHRKGPKFIVLTNTNADPGGVFHYVANVTVDGTNIQITIDPRVDNKGGGW